ncbi:unnamed protein product, partial [Porites lobata]
EYFLQNTVISLFSIALNLGSCPVIIMMNVLVIVAIKTRRRLQSDYNILLACLAGTDLAVGLVSQPLFIAQEILFLSGASLVDYCDFYRKIVFVFLVPCIESLLILAILSTERYIAMKYSLRYNSILTTPRLIGAVVCSWLISTSSLIFWLIPATRSRLSGLLVYATVFPATLIIISCHTKKNPKSLRRLQNAQRDITNLAVNPWRWIVFKEYFLENTVISLFSIALNLGSCPVIIMMNVLVIVAIKTRRRLQSEYNILLACLAGTDLAVGLVSQPLFIAQEILFLSGASLVDYCDFFRKTVFVFLVPCIESLLILAILSTERYIAMKYSLRYASIVTTPRLIGAVVCSWLVSTSSLIFWLIPATRSVLSGLLVYATIFPATLIIVSCHTKVYFVSRRHMNQIKTQRLPSETKANQNSALNVSIICRSREDEYIYILVNTFASLFSITVNLGSCPVIIFMNVLVIVAIKTRRRLQSEYNILLACLAGTDLAVGLVSQPLFIAQEIYFLSGASLVDYCRFYRRIVFVYLVPCTESLLILAILSTERYIAMKYSLRYASIVTTPKLIGAVVCSWFISTMSFIFWIIPATRSTLSGRLVYLTVTPAILVIMFCHTTVYFVSRRHMNQIKTQQLPSETRAKFLEERKALKTISIILAFLFFSYIPGILDGLFRLIGILPKNQYEKQMRLLPIAFLCVFLNSLFNPLIYCWRNKDLRKVMLELIKIRQHGR